MSLDQRTEANAANITRLLRVIAESTNAKATSHDVIFDAAADLIDDLVARLRLPGSISMEEAAADNFGLTANDLD